jgi:hypothetical protein
MAIVSLIRSVAEGAGEQRPHQDAAVSAAQTSTIDDLRTEYFVAIFAAIFSSIN